MRPKAFALLNYLLQRPGQLVTKDELLNAVWPETFVGDAVLKVTVQQLRETLEDDSKSPQFIETAHRRGYRFIGQIKSAEQPPPLQDNFYSGAFPAFSDVVGREQSLARLQRWLRRMMSGEQQLGFITGEAGIGKTSLVDAFVRTIPANGTVRVARGQCLEQYGTSEAYLPVLDAIGRLCREEPKVTELLRVHAPLWLLQMPWLLSPSDRELLSREIGGATRERMLREMGEALTLLAAKVPLVLILEDLHWSDFATLDLISYLARQRRPAHLMVIGTYRDIELNVSGHPLRAVKEELITKQLCKELPLEYLSVAATSDYLTVRFLRNNFPARLAQLIHQRTEGNPLFMVNIVDYLLETGLIVLRNTKWELSVDIDKVEVGVPDNIRWVIESQIALLEPDKQKTLAAASVAGVEFSTLALAAGLEEDPLLVEERCLELAHQGQYIQARGVHELPDGTLSTRYGFVHALYQNVLYERMPETRRAHVHWLIAKRGEEVYGERAPEISVELAMHFERGRDYQRAAQYLKQGANIAIRRFAYQEAVSLARRGIDLIGKLPTTSETMTEALCLHLTLGVPLIALEGYASPNVGRVYLKARELYDRLGDSPDISEVLWGLWTFHTLRADLETARKIAEEFLRMSERLPYPGLAMRGHWALETTFLHLGDFELALDHYEQALAVYDPTQHRDDSFFYALNPGVAVPCFAAWALWFTGFPEEALERIDEALTRARELSEPHGLAHAAFFASVLYQLRRDHLMAQYYAEAVIDISREHGLALYGAMAAIMQGWTLSKRGGALEAIPQIREGLAALDATGTFLVRPHFLALMSEVFSKAGQTEEALRLLDEAIEMVNSKGERYYEAELYRLKGELLLKQTKDNQATAESLFNRSLAIAESQKAKSWQARTALSLARLYRTQDKFIEAHKLLAPIYESFTEGFETDDLRDVATLLHT